MLRKLMKHELRATGRVMLPLYLVVLITSVGANLSTRVLTELDNDFLNLLGVLLLTAFFIAIFSVCLVSFILMIRRFYKNLLQDEGYVMMTLPVSVHQHIWSKLLVSMLWFVATAAVVILAVLLLTFEVNFVKELIAFVQELIRAINDLPDMIRVDHAAGHAMLFGAELLVLLFVSGAGACLQFYAAMAIGHSFASHKILLSVVIYFGMQFVLQLLGGGFLLTQMLPGVSGIAAGHLFMGAIIAAGMVVAAVFYFLTAYFLKKRLNLE